MNTLPITEVAKVAGIPRGTLSTWIHRGFIRREDRVADYGFAETLAIVFLARLLRDGINLRDASTLAVDWCRSVGEMLDDPNVPDDQPFKLVFISGTTRYGGEYECAGTESQVISGISGMLARGATKIYLWDATEDWNRVMAAFTAAGERHQAPVREPEQVPA